MNNFLNKKFIFWNFKWTNFEEFGIIEQEFLEIFESSPIYIIFQSKIFDGDLSEILILKQYKEILMKYMN